MVVKPERTAIIIGKIGDNITFPDVNHATLHCIGLDPLHGLHDIHGFVKQDSANNAVKIGSGNNPHE
jgi:hypothetical protein